MKAFKTLLCFVFVLMAFAYAGRVDWSEQIILSMPGNVYEQICLKLGHGCNSYDIATEYMNNRAFYDNLSE